MLGRLGKAELRLRNFGHAEAAFCEAVNRCGGGDGPLDELHALLAQARLVFLCAGCYAVLALCIGGGMA